MIKKTIRYFTKIKWIISSLLLPATLVYAGDDYQFYFSSTFNIGFSDSDTFNNLAGLPELNNS